MSSDFNFLQHWYPLTPIADLRPDYPTPVTVLGIRIVLWKPRHAATYRAFIDQCPHRLAPLSEGRIDEQTGQLMCSYHGWQFDAEGKCQVIPQAEADFHPAQHSHLCATALPCQVVNDLLWVWPDANSTELAAETPLPLSPQIDASQGFVWDSYVRDLEYDWQTLVENVVDPSHVPFAHHGVQGNRAQARPVPLQITQSTPTCIEAKSEGRFNTKMTFEPPCRVEYAIAFGADKQVGLVTYCVPTVPGKCRIVAQFPRNFAQTAHRWTPRWFSHIKTRNAVLDGDMVLLQQQEQILQQQPQGQSWAQAYKLATSADRFVIEFRKWFDRHCDSTLPWPGGLAKPDTRARDRRQVLDRYHQHTQLCSSCRQALQWVERAEWGLLGLAVLVVAIVAALPDALRLLPGVPLLVLALGSLGLAAWLKFRVEPQFRFVDYIHVEHR